MNERQEVRSKPMNQHQQGMGRRQQQTPTKEESRQPQPAKEEKNGQIRPPETIDSIMEIAGMRFYAEQDPKSGTLSWTSRPPEKSAKSVSTLPRHIE